MTRFIDLTLNGISTGAVYAAVALALVLIWRATRIVNFAQGAMLMFTTSIALGVINSSGSYWLGFAVALLSGLLLGALVERVLIRRVEAAPPLNAVIVALGLLILLEAGAGMIWGNTPRSFPPAFSIRGYDIGGTRVLFSPNDTFIVLVVLAVAFALRLLFLNTSIGLKMRAAAFRPEVARLLGVRVGRMFTLGWALAALVGSLAGVLVAPSVFVGPNQFDSLLVFGFTAAVLGGLDSPLGAVVGGMLLGLVLSYVSGYEGASLVTLAALVVLILGVDDPSQRAVLEHERASRMRALAQRLVNPKSTLARSLGLVVLAALALLRGQRADQPLSEPAAGKRRLLLRRARRSDGAHRPERSDLARSRRADGGRRLHRGAADRQRALAAGGRAGRGGRRQRGRGRRRRGGGVAAARALPRRRHAGVRDRPAGARRQVPEHARRRERAGESIRRCLRRGWAAAFRLERWEAWIACAGALAVMFVMNNFVRSDYGRAFRAVRDDEIAASLCGLRVGRVQTLAFVVSAACAGLGGGLLAVVLQLASPGAFTLELSLALLTAVVLGGLGSLVGAVWGAAVLVLLPTWTEHLAHSFSLSMRVSSNLPLAIYGLVLIVAMLLWPSGIQGALRALIAPLRARLRPAVAGGETERGGE